jgi:hypothetical protein
VILGPHTNHWDFSGRKNRVTIIPDTGAETSRTTIRLVYIIDVYAIYINAYVNIIVTEEKYHPMLRTDWGFKLSAIIQVTL